MLTVGGCSGWSVCECVCRLWYCTRPRHCIEAADIAADAWEKKKGGGRAEHGLGDCDIGWRVVG